MTTCDVAVVGLGAMGSAALFHLARRGVRAIGIERFHPGHDRGSSHGESRIIRLAYFEHPAYVPLLRRAYENWCELERLAGESLLTTTGILEAGPPGSPLVAGSLQACREHGIDHETLDAAEIGRRFPAFRLPEAYAGVWQKDGGWLRPEAAVRAQARLAEAAGARIVDGVVVRAITPRPGHVEIDLGGRIVQAGRVVVAAGAWMAALVPELAPHLRLTRQVMCWYDPAEPVLFAPGRLPVFIAESEDDAVYGFPDIGGGFKCASHRIGRTLGHADQARQDASPEDAAPTDAFLERFMPAARGRLRAMKTCIYTRAPDEDFILDTLPADPRIVVASPCSGHGFKFASVIGEILADLATRGQTDHDIGRLRLGRLGVS